MDQQVLQLILISLLGTVITRGSLMMCLSHTTVADQGDRTQVAAPALRSKCIVHILLRYLDTL